MRSNATSSVRSPPRRSPASEPSDGVGRLLASRLTLTLVFLGCTILCIVSYAGPSLSVAKRLGVDGSLAALWLIACAGIGSTVLAGVRLLSGPKLFRPRGTEGQRLLYFVTATALGLGVSSLLILGLGVAGWLNRPIAIGIIAIGVVLSAWAVVRSKPDMAGLIEEWTEPAGWSWLWLVAAPLLAMAIIGAITPSGILWGGSDPNFYDVVEYHLQVPREWLEAGQIIPLHHNVFSFLPFNVELHYLLAMYVHGGAWSGMYLAQMMHLVFVGLSVVAVYAIARQHAAALAAMTAGLAVVTTPWIVQLAAVAYDEGGFLLFGTMAIGWAMEAIEKGEICAGRLLLAGAFGGFACGVKLTAAPEVLLGGAIALAVVLLVQRRDSWGATSRRAMAAASVYLIGGLVTFSPWLIRDQAWAHNPIFPEGARQLGPGHFTPVQVERWDRAHSPRPDQRSLAGRFSAAGSQILGNWQYGYVLIPLGLIAALMSFRDRRTIFLACMMLALAVTWLFATHLQARFFILAVPVSGLLLSRLKSSWSSMGALAIVLVAAAAGGRQVDHHLAAFLYGGKDSPLNAGVVPLLGSTDLSGVEEHVLKDLPQKDIDVVLVGDAKAFWYPIPMSRLRYRTVFDVRMETGDAVRDWENGPLPANARVIIDTAEIQRLHRTYWKIPAVPESLLEKSRRRSARTEPATLSTPTP